MKHRFRKITTRTAVVGAAVLTATISYGAPGYKDGQSLPMSYAQTIYAHNQGVIADDGLDDSAALQSIIDSISLNNSPDNLIRILLPAGEITLADEVHVDRSGVLIEGRGTAISGGTHLVVNSWKPYSGSAFEEPVFDKKYWPGFGAFRIETRRMHPNEQAYEGSINYHWKHSIEFGSPASKGDTVLYLESGGAGKFTVGDLIYVGAANDDAFLDEGKVPASRRGNNHIKNGHMRTQMFHVTSVDTAANTVTIDQPLEYSIELTNRHGYKSRVMPVTAVQNVGFRKFTLTMNKLSTDCANYNRSVYSASNPNGVGHRYENFCPADAIHGLVFKWADDAFVDQVDIEMMGSHPVVTEFVKNATFQNMSIDGSWNKGKGGNGYFRGSKLYNSVIRNNTIENVRHLTLQWSSTGNIVENNTMNVDMNLHGGWERNNVIRNNTISVPFEHRSWANGAPEGGTWQPIWWGSGDHASKWSGPTGPNNRFVNNTLRKAKTSGSAIERWGLFDTPDVTYAFAWNGSEFSHLNVSGSDVPTWDQALAEGVYAGMPGSGVWTDGDSDPIEDPVEDPVDPEEPEDPPVGGCSEVIDYSWKSKQEVVTGNGVCVRFDRELASRTNQFWDSDANTSCNFRGSVTSVDGSGSLTIDGNYESSSGFSGTLLSFSSTNACPYIKVRAY